jgi:hypothetical protein
MKPNIPPIPIIVGALGFALLYPTYDLQLLKQMEYARKTMNNLGLI